ncbi:hypothetical protein [Crossiella sp. CA198]|uniref:hypothetical protein n=1 Tax=Crossiella sp. CA198 TaxID=3455607 RepID=UPI003F8D1A7C
MTVPKVRTIQRGGSRFYIHPQTNDRVPGVTSVVGMLPKSFLTAWAAKKTAESAVEFLGEVVGIAMRDRPAAIDFLKRSYRRDTAAAADIGTEVHEVCERLARGQAVGRLHPDIEVFATGFREFLETYQPEWLELEATVWSERYGYAGSFDWIARIGSDIVIGDNKTTRSGVHADVALQLAAYAHADYILRPDGTRDPLPEITSAAVLHLRPDTDDPTQPAWKLVPIRIEQDVFDAFLSLREVFRWDREIQGTVLGAPLTPERAGVVQPTRTIASPRRRAA